MRKLTALSALAFMLLTPSRAGAGDACAGSPATPNVYDSANKIDDDAVQAAIGRLEHLDDADVHVIVIDTTETGLDNFYTSMLRTCANWRTPGSRAETDGLFVVAVAVSDRQTGVYSDAPVKAELDAAHPNGTTVRDAVQIDIMNPSFKQGNFTQGVIDGLDAYDSHLGGRRQQGESRTPADGSTTANTTPAGLERAGGGGGVPVVVFAVLAALLAALGLAAYGASKARAARNVRKAVAHARSRIGELTFSIDESVAAAELAIDTAKAKISDRTASQLAGEIERLAAQRDETLAQFAAISGKGRVQLRELETVRSQLETIDKTLRGAATAAARSSDLYDKALIARENAGGKLSVLESEIEQLAAGYVTAPLDHIAAETRAAVETLDATIEERDGDKATAGLGDVESLTEQLTDTIAALKDAAAGNHRAIDEATRAWQVLTEREQAATQALSRMQGKWERNVWNEFAALTERTETARRDANRLLETARTMMNGAKIDALQAHEAILQAERKRQQLGATLDACIDRQQACDIAEAKLGDGTRDAIAALSAAETAAATHRQGAGAGEKAIRKAADLIADINNATPGSDPVTLLNAAEHATDLAADAKAAIIAAQQTHDRLTAEADAQQRRTEDAIGDARRAKNSAHHSFTHHISVQQLERQLDDAARETDPRNRLRLLAAVISSAETLERAARSHIAPAQTASHRSGGGTNTSWDSGNRRQTGGGGSSTSW